MEQQRLRRSDLQVSPIAFGTWQLGGEWGAADETAAIAAIRHAAERWRRLVEDGYGRLDVSAARLGLDAEPQMARVVEGGRRRHHEGVVMSTVSVVVTGTAAGGRKVVPDAE